MCFWIHEPTGQVSQHFDSIAEAWAAPGPWHVWHPLHQPGWVLDGRGCEYWLAAALLEPQPYWGSNSLSARRSWMAGWEGAPVPSGRGAP
jgi:hypothetical protein